MNPMLMQGSECKMRCMDKFSLELSIFLQLLILFQNQNIYKSWWMGNWKRCVFMWICTWWSFRCKNCWTYYI